MAINGIPLELQLLCLLIAAPWRRHGGAVIRGHEALCLGVAVSHQLVAVFEVVVGRDLGILLGDMHQEGPVVVDDLRHSQGAGLIHCIV